MTSKDISITYGKEAGDCTRPYLITLNRSDITVREFMEYVMSEFKSEWGYIRIWRNEIVNPWISDYSLEYSHGIAKSAFPQRILKSHIKKLSGDGGWTRSDWYIVI